MAVAISGIIHGLRTSTCLGAGAGAGEGAGAGTGADGGTAGRRGLLPPVPPGDALPGRLPGNGD